MKKFATYIAVLIFGLVAWLPVDNARSDEKIALPTDQSTYYQVQAPDHDQGRNIHKKNIDENKLPPLSEDRAVRLNELFAILQKSEDQELQEKAEEEIKSIWEESGSDTINLLLRWANQAINKKNYAAALDHLDYVVRLRPQFAEGWNKRATVYFLQRDFGRSIQDVERVLELEPRHFGALAGLALILIEYGDDKRALDILRRALVLNPRSDEIKKRVERLTKSVEGRET